MCCAFLGCVCFCLVVVESVKDDTATVTVSVPRVEEVATTAAVTSASSTDLAAAQTASLAIEEATRVLTAAGRLFSPSVCFSPS